jgi:hypothetical protein
VRYPTPAELAAITDPAERAERAGALAKAGRDAVDVRDSAIVELLAAGDLRPFEIGRLAGVSNTQMVRYGKRLEAQRA